MCTCAKENWKKEMNLLLPADDKIVYRLINGTGRVATCKRKALSTHLYAKVWQIFSVNGQVVVILGFAIHKISFKTTQLSHYSTTVVFTIYKQMYLTVF